MDSSLSLLYNLYIRLRELSQHNSRLTLTKSKHFNKERSSARWQIPANELEQEL